MLGLSVNYLRYNDARSDGFNPITGVSHGLTEANEVISCETTKIAKGQYIDNLRVSYTENDLVSLSFQTKNPEISEKVYGKPFNGVQFVTVVKDASPEGSLLYGFKSRASETG